MGVKLGNGKWAIKEDKLLAYNDNSGRFFNKEFDFSRGSSATYVAKDGLIKTAGLQATNLVNNGDFSELGSELVTNGDFATDSDWAKGTGWTIASNLANFNGLGFNAFRQNVGLITGKIYKVTFDLNITSGNVIFQLGGATNTFNSSATHTFYDTATANGVYSTFISLYSSTSSTFSIDNVSVKQVDPNDYWTLGTGWSFGDGVANCDGSQTGNSNLQSSTFDFSENTTVRLSFNVVNYSAGNLAASVTGTGQADLTGINSNGTYSVTVTSSAGSRIVDFTADTNFIGSVSNISIQEIQTDTPRIDFSDSVKGALLLEPQSTNLLTYSEDFSQWTSHSVTVTSNQVLAPDGTLTADKLDFSASTSARLANVISTSSGTYTFSIYLKSGSGSGYFRLAIVKQGGTAITQTILLTEEWQRFELEYIYDGLTNLIPYVGYYIDDTYLQEVYAWGAQLEEKSFATSYIPNHGVSGGVTRLADVCNNSGSAQDFNSEEGVLYAEIAALANENSTTAISINDGTTSNAVQLFITNTINQIRARVSNSTAQFFEEITLSDITNFNKIAIKYKQNDFALWVNGNEVATDTSGNTPLGLNNLSFDRGDGANDFNAKIREVQVFTEALTDEQLQKLTTI